MPLDALVRSQIIERLDANGAVVLERLARAAGQTNWYWCEDQNGLDQIVSALSPGSVVSFYFDGRIAKCAYTPQVKREIEDIARRDGDAVIGALCADGLRIECDFVSSGDEVEEFVAGGRERPFIYFGAFPSADNDGIAAVTVTLPDLDGVVRRHPH